MIDDHLYDFNRETRNIVEYNLATVAVVHIADLNVFYTAIKASLNNLKKKLDNLPVSKSPLEYRGYLFNEVLNKMRQNALVGMFHLWLRNLQEFLAISGDAINDKKFIMLDKGYEFILGLFQTDKNLEQYIYIIAKYGCLVNVIKHGFGKSFDKLKRNYSEFLYPPAEYDETIIINGEKIKVIGVNAPYVLEKNIKEFYEASKGFWQNIPEKLVIDFTEKTPNRVI